MNVLTSIKSWNVLASELRMRKPKRLLFVLHSLALAGDVRLVLEMAKTLKRDFVVGICCLDEKGFFWSQAEEAGITLYCINRKPGMRLETFLRMIRVIHKFKPHVIHAHHYTPYFYSVVSKMVTFCRARLIFTEHGRHFPDRVTRERKWLNQFLLKFTDEITAVCQFSASRLYELEGVRSKAIRIIYNGIRNNIGQGDKRDLRNELNIEKETKIIGFVGTLRAIKNPLFLLRSFRRVVQKSLHTALVFIGDGPLKEEIKQTAKALGLDRKVYVPGALYPAEAYLSSFDVFVLPSFSEAASLALLEAMAQRVPVIVTDRGGSPEIVTNNETGYVVRCDDEEALSKSISELLENRGTNERIRSEGKKLVRERFSFDEMLNQYLAIYEGKEPSKSLLYSPLREK
jgi:glycosyltransferase involved in cell wall biosynthesis